MRTTASLKRFERLLVLVLGVAIGVLGSAVVTSSGDAALSGPRTSISASSEPIGVTSVRFMEAPGEALCAILDDGSVRCAGAEGWGELTPPTGIKFRDVAPGRETSCGVTLDGKVLCWGIWSGTVRTQGSVDSIAAYDEHALCVIDASQRLVCFNMRELERSAPISDVAVQNITNLSNWYLTFCGLEPQGNVTCFNADGSRIGNAQTLAPPRGLLLQVVRLSHESGCGLDLAGSVRCWGLARSVADAPSGPFVDLAVGFEAACGLRADGTVACWGSSSSRPPRDARFTSIALSAWSPGLACGVTTRGEAVCWGVGDPDALQRSLDAW
jgi:hypothetical protein